MKYVSGDAAQVGDSVLMGADCGGSLLADLTVGTFDESLEREAWEHLGRGLLFDFECAGIVHVESQDAMGGIALVSRA